jgi:hypothetical protein
MRAVKIPDFAEPVIGRRIAPTRWLHPGYDTGILSSRRSRPQAMQFWDGVKAREAIPGMVTKAVT